MFIKIVNYPKEGMERVIECEEFILDEPWYRLGYGDPESTTKESRSSKLNIIKRILGGEYETEVIEITDLRWTTYIMSSETGKTIDSYRWGHVCVNGPIVRSSK